MKKYELTNETKKVGSVTLHRIRALKDFGKVVEGELGGWLESEANLSQNGNCWVEGNAMVYGNALIRKNAYVSGNAVVEGNAIVSDYAEIYGNAYVTGYSVVRGYAHVNGNAFVKDYAEISENAYVAGRASIEGASSVKGNTTITGRAYVMDVRLSGNTTLKENACVLDEDDYLTIQPIGSENGVLTAFRTICGNVEVVRGCFLGTLDEFKEAVKKKHAGTKYEKEYELVIKLIENRLLK